MKQGNAMRTRGLSCLALLWVAVSAGAIAAKGVVYRVSAEQAPTSYLVGTMHSEDPRLAIVVERLVPLIEQVDTVAIEIIPDALALVAVGAATLLPGDRRLQDIIGDERFLAAVVVAEQRGIPAPALQRLKPWAVALLIGTPATHSGRFLDMEIYLQALERERKTVGIETVAEQIAVFDQLGLQQQLLILDDAVANAGSMPQQLEQLTALYLEGDLDGLAGLATGQYRAMPGGVGEWFERVLIHDRNRRMLERLQPTLASGSVLIAVGALHLVGETGLIAGLRRLGYRVEALGAASGS